MPIKTTLPLVVAMMFLSVGHKAIAQKEICLGPGCPTEDPKCVNFTWKPQTSYQVGDRVENGNRCAIDGDAYYLSISSNNKGNDPRNDPFNWHSTCGICGSDPVLHLLREYRELKESIKRQK